MLSKKDIEKFKSDGYVVVDTDIPEEQIEDVKHFTKISRHDGRLGNA